MANANRPSGLSPVQYLNGTPWNGGCRTYVILNTEDTNAYAIGDPVKLASGADAAGIPSVVLYAAGGGVDAPCVGVIVGVNGSVYGGAFGVPSTDPIVIPATKTKDYYVLVCDDPNVIFEVQEIGTGTYLAAADVGLNADLVAGTNNGYVSGWMLTNSTEAVTATLDCKILQLAPRADNAIGQYAKWWVTINNHAYRTSVKSVA